MAIIHEEVFFDGAEVSIMVSERKKDEFREQWQIIGIDVSSFDNYSPKKLRELGRWLVKQGNRIGKEYKSNGAPKKKCTDK